MNKSRDRRIGLRSRLEAVETSGANVQLDTELGRSLAAVLRSDTKSNRLVLRLPDRTSLRGEGSNWYERFRSLRALLEQRQLRLRACGNCVAFVFSEMSHQFSDGSKGYCTIGKRRAEDARLEDVVSIFDVCEAFHYGPQCQ